MIKVNIFSKYDAASGQEHSPLENMDETVTLATAFINHLLRSGKRSIDHQTLVDVFGGKTEEVKKLLAVYRQAGHWTVKITGGPGHFPGSTDSPLTIQFR